eukprot:GCRY01004294.1.p1 GENE.GCRY01004294.1~~GCRY01004294.1.p1  ORF type:complete len:270 (-),score=15.95 GCRY01004294.1:474-1283(-)
MKTVKEKSTAKTSSGSANSHGQTYKVRKATTSLGEVIHPAKRAERREYNCFPTYSHALLCLMYNVDTVRKREKSHEMSPAGIAGGEMAKAVPVPGWHIAPRHIVDFRKFVPRKGLPNPPHSPEEKAFLRPEIQNDLRKGLISEISSRAAVATSPIFVVKQPFSGKMRKVNNLKFVNDAIECKSVRQEAVNKLRETVFPGAYMTTLDIFKAFRHVMINPEHRRFVAFRFEGKTFQDNVLPFGRKVSPYWWNKTTRVLLKELRVLGIQFVL